MPFTYNPAAPVVTTLEALIAYVDENLGGTPTPTPTPTPAPTFTAQPSIASDGTPQVGEQLTGNDGTISNGSVSARQWLLSGTAISGATGATYTPTATGDHAYRVTATGAGGTATATSAAVSVAAATPTPTVSRQVAEGDSITAAAGTYANQYDAAYPSLDFTNLAVGGSGVATMTQRLPQLQAINPSDLSILIGANDATPDATFYNNLVTYMSDARTRMQAGAKIAVGTLLPQSASGWPAKRSAANTRIEAASTSVIDVVIPFADDPIYGPDAAGSDTSLFGDGLHPSATVQARMFQCYKAVMNPLIARSTATQPDAFTLSPVTNAAPSTDYVAEVWITGLAARGTTSISVSGNGVMSAGLSGYGTTAQSGCNGTCVRLKITSSASASTARSATLTIGNKTATFTVTTAAAAVNNTAFDPATKAPSLELSNSNRTVKQLFVDNGEVRGDTARGIGSQVTFGVSGSAPLKTAFIFRDTAGATKLLAFDAGESGGYTEVNGSQVSNYGFTVGDQIEWKLIPNETTPANFDIQATKAGVIRRFVTNSALPVFYYVGIFGSTTTQVNIVDPTKWNPAS